MKILVLAGTEGARILCHKLSEIKGIEVIVSLFQKILPSDYPGQIIAGGFGGVDGLANYLQQERIGLLIDATHPYSSTINSNAIAASRKTGTEYIRLVRKKWVAGPGDNWLEFPTLLQACQKIPPKSRIFAALGGKNLGRDIEEISNSLAQSRVYLRVMEYPSFEIPPNWNMLEYIPPITFENEKALLMKYGITHILCRNSGGEISKLKLKAGAELGLEIFMLARPCDSEDNRDFKIFSTVEELLKSRFKMGKYLFDPN
ncbi:MAG: precorrin-6A/cobalt-precorrin-6A reductase [Rhodobacteraceae bacterium]|nr:precorrin-6A/cobalt-precorrin-6A reductase [Paracoccaceae bacterium]